MDWKTQETHERRVAQSARAELAELVKKIRDGSLTFTLQSFLRILLTDQEAREADNCAAEAEAEATYLSMFDSLKAHLKAIARRKDRDLPNVLRGVFDPVELRRAVADHLDALASHDARTNDGKTRPRTRRPGAGSDSHVWPQLAERLLLDKRPRPKSGRTYSPWEAAVARLIEMSTVARIDDAFLREWAIPVERRSASEARGCELARLSERRVELQLLSEMRLSHPMQADSWFGSLGAAGLATKPPIDVPLNQAGQADKEPAPGGTQPDRKLSPDEFDFGEGKVLTGLPAKQHKLLRTLRPAGKAGVPVEIVLETLGYRPDRRKALDELVRRTQKTMDAYEGLNHLIEVVNRNYRITSTDCP